MKMHYSLVKIVHLAVCSRKCTHIFNIATFLAHTIHDTLDVKSIEN